MKKMAMNKFIKTVILFAAAFIISFPNPAHAQFKNAIEFQKTMAEQAEKSANQEKNDSTEAKGGRYGLGSLLSDSFSWNPLKGISNLIGNVQNLGGKKMVYTYPDGRTEEYVMTLWGTANSTQGVTKGCPPIGISIIENRSCIFCPLFAVLYTAANDMSELAFRDLAGAMAKVMLVGFGLYIMFKALPFVSSLTKQDAPKFLVEILTQASKVTISFVLLSSPDQVYQYFISPVLGAGLEFGAAMLFNIGDQFTSCASSIEITGDKSLLPIALYAKLDCFIRSIQAEISIMQTVGSTLMCVGRHEGTIKAAGIDFGLWDFGMVFQGLIVWGFAVLLSLAFAFYLIDATVTLGLVGALMPFLIACWPFKLTTGYSKKGIEMFLNTFFVFVFMGIVVSINVQLIGTALSGGTGTEAAAAAESGGGAMSGLLDAISGNDIDKLKEMTDLGFGGFLILLCCCVFGFKFTSQATTLADKMASGGISGIGNKIGGLAASGAMGIAKKATQPARKAVSQKAGELTERAGNAIGKRLGLGKHGGKTGDAKSGGGGNKGGGGSSGGGGDSSTADNKRPNRGSGPGGGKGHGAKKQTKGGKFQENFNKLKKSRKKQKARDKRNHK